MSGLRIVFMGTPAFAVPSLAGLVASGHNVVAVYTQPPRPSGRGHRIQPSPVHQFAEDHGIEVRHPASLKSAQAQEAFRALTPDLAVVVAYGLILPRAVLDTPPHGCINLHASLLPRWRGAAPIQRAIMAGDTRTGVQVMQMEAGLDTGPILLSETVAIASDDTAGTLTERLSAIGGDLLPRAIAALARGGLTPTPQREEDGVTYAHKITPQEARVDWSVGASAIDAHIRGLSPVPGAWTELAREATDPVRLKLLFSTVEARAAGGHPPGTILGTGPEGVDVASGDDATVRVVKLQRPGKAAQDAEAFLRGFPMAPGDLLR